MSVPRLLPILTIACLAASLVAGSAMAGDEVVATRTGKLPTKDEIAKADAAAEAKAALTPKPASTQSQVIARLAAAPRIDRADDSQAWDSQAGDNPSNPHQIHGSVSVSLGTGGYRSASAFALIPVGEEGLLGISVSQTDFGNNSAYGYGYGYPGAYGYGYGDDFGYDQTGYGYPGYGAGYGYGARGYEGRGYGWAPRRGTSQSFGVSLDMSGRSRSQSDTPEGCAPGFRDGDRYVEPVWVKRDRDDHSCKAAEHP